MQSRLREAEATRAKVADGSLSMEAAVAAAVSTAAAAVAMVVAAKLLSAAIRKFWVAATTGGRRFAMRLTRRQAALARHATFGTCAMSTRTGSHARTLAIALCITRVRPAP